jgi:cysteine synthase A
MAVSYVLFMPIHLNPEGLSALGICTVELLMNSTITLAMSLRPVQKVGDTPLIEIDGIFAKLECLNPTGSIKDRIAKYIIDESEKRGLLKPGMTIIEATSGNTGIAYSHYAIQKGYKVTIVMPRNMSDERKSIMKGLGAELILCSDGDFAGAARIRDDMARDPNFFNPDQFSNPLNTECHYTTTGREILAQMGQHNLKVDAFVAGVGTGGTLMGVGKALAESNGKVHLAAVEPTESAVMSGGQPGLHFIQGIGDGFIPALVLGNDGTLSRSIDEVICISSEDARKAARYLEKEKSVCVGISSGANYLAAKMLAERFETVVTVFADGYGKYKSYGLKRSENAVCSTEKDCMANH